MESLQNEQLLNQLNGELADAKDLLSDMHDHMSSMPSADYLKRMQETALRIEELEKKITNIANGSLYQEAQNDVISKFTISPLPQPINGSVAICTATFYNTLTVNGITINDGRKGLYVKMPQKRTVQGNYIDVAHPLSSDTRRNINQVLLSAYREGKFHQEFDVAQPKTILAQNSVKNPPSYGNSLARMDLVVGDMVVHNAKIFKGNDDKLHLTMPGYRTKDGKYTSLCIPANKEAFAEFSKKAMEEFNTDYSFRKLSDDDVSALRESGIKLQSHKNKQGENIVKFKTEDLAKVNSVVSTAKPTPKIQ